MKHCTYHCRGCDSCFTSLAAFDAHRTGPFDGTRACTFPGDVDWEEHRGVCRVSEFDDETGQPIPRAVVVYALALSAERRATLERLRGSNESRTGVRDAPSLLKSAA